PQVSSIAFPAPLPDLQPWPLMDMDFVISRPLVRPGMPDIRFLFVRSRFCSALPSDATSRSLRWNAESDLDLADIGGKAGASTHVANVASPRRRPKAARHLDMAAARHAEARR